MTWIVSKRDVMAANGMKVTFRFDIKETMEVGDLMVVVLDVPPHEVMTENVFGVSKEGQIQWQIEAIPETSANAVDVYTGINWHKDGIVSIYNWGGTTVLVDAQTGKVIERGVSK